MIDNLLRFRIYLSFFPFFLIIQNFHKVVYAPLQKNFYSFARDVMWDSSCLQISSEAWK